jgi:hypothetical protein
MKVKYIHLRNNGPKNVILEIINVAGSSEL